MILLREEIKLPVLPEVAIDGSSVMAVMTIARGIEGARVRKDFSHRFLPAAG